MFTPIRAFFLILTIATISIAVKDIETGRFYHIQSHDGSVITVAGDNSRTVKIITEELKGTEPRQQFRVGPGPESHYIFPRQQNALSQLVFDLDLPTGLLHQDIRRGARHQWWFINDIGDNKWTIQNVRSGHCLSTKGTGSQIYSAVCDRSSTNQTWIFAVPPIAIRDKIKNI